MGQFRKFFLNDSIVELILDHLLEEDLVWVDLGKLSGKNLSGVEGVEIRYVFEG